mgnify:CR=1 FL=1
MHDHKNFDETMAERAANSRQALINKFYLNEFFGDCPNKERDSPEEYEYNLNWLLIQIMNRCG